ncbi:MAG: YezD family protein [Candidatus Omnitrophica bacterium]|nr:YezD family protein [Candidatus Omnitrophota bacterium]
MSEVIDDQVRRRLNTLSKGLRYGSLHLVVHDGKVTQIERIEKVRLEKKENSDQTTGGTSP